MPIVDKRDPSNWYNHIRISNPRETGYNPFADPDFKLSKMQANEYRQPDGSIVAKVPQMEGRIFQQYDEDRKETHVVLLADAYYDEDEQEMQKQEVILGTAIHGLYEGLMLVNENYHVYYDRNGNLINDPLQ